MNPSTSIYRSTYYVPGTISGVQDIKMNKTQSRPPRIPESGKGDTCKTHPSKSSAWDDVWDAMSCMRVQLSLRGIWKGFSWHFCQVLRNKVRVFQAEKRKKGPSWEKWWVRNSRKRGSLCGCRWVRKWGEQSDQKVRREKWNIGFKSLKHLS